MDFKANLDGLKKELTSRGFDVTALQAQMEAVLAAEAAGTEAINAAAQAITELQETLGNIVQRMAAMEHRERLRNGAVESAQVPKIEEKPRNNALIVSLTACMQPRRLTFIPGNRP